MTDREKALRYIVEKADALLLITSKIYALPPNLPQYPGLSRLELILLLYLSKGDKTVALKELIATFKLSKQQMSKMISRLEERGWLDKGPAADDRRVLAIRLSEEGKRRMADIAEIRIGRFARETARLSDETLVEIAGHFRAISQALGRD